jgi:hypothetical protein
MTSTRLVYVALALITASACSRAEDGPTEPGVVVGEVSLPVAGAVYRGTGPHLFLDGRASLDCGGHGGFTNAVQPPAQTGATVMSDYVATFVGELVLQPPAVSSAATHMLAVQARMTERITFTERRGETRIFDTELVTFELRAGMPPGVVVRESPRLQSAGVTTITAASGGLSRVESYYDVWLEISLDGGRSWHPAQQAVRMALERS